MAWRNNTSRGSVREGASVDDNGWAGSRKIGLDFRIR